MTENYVGRRLIRLIPLALAAILLILIGPEKLQYLPAWERWGILGCVLLAFVASITLGKYLGPSGTSAHMRRLVGYARPNRMSRNPVVFHSTLAPEAVADTLRRSI